MRFYVLFPVQGNGDALAVNNLPFRATSLSLNKLHPVLIGDHPDIYGMLCPCANLDRQTIGHCEGMLLFFPLTLLF